MSLSGCYICWVNGCLESSRTDMFLPGYAEPLLAMAGVGLLMGLYGVWMVRQRERERREIEREHDLPPA